MTNEEAIHIIKTAIVQVEWNYPMDYITAFNMAIDALNQSEIVKCKYCQWWDGSKCENDNISRKIQDCGCYPEFRTEPDWFCAEGEGW